ncbi:hypothetical protein FNV43_RR15608 [Rhamnella rubrinervis]|uniref:Histidine-containing phosphotransfer protein n=1 Tax=Rhamnella rubrinervis TaxID=2594499 RepID=A0A8K0E838_9ROSA|nr:hypothetical protein FNV43_RR15608 [Rhamnella rubrinervis]
MTPTNCELEREKTVQVVIPSGHGKRLRGSRRTRDAKFYSLCNGDSPKSEPVISGSGGTHPNSSTARVVVFGLGLSAQAALLKWYWADEQPNRPSPVYEEAALADTTGPTYVLGVWQYEPWPHRLCRPGFDFQIAMSNMALSAYKSQLKNLVQSMLDEGILDSQFAQLQALQDASSPNFVADVISVYCNEAERIITELNSYICSQQDIDFSKMDANVHQLKGSSSSIGAKRVTLACVELRQAFDDKNRERCIKALNRIRQEYYFYLQGKFQTLMQLEKTISAIETNQQMQDGNFSIMRMHHHI